MYQDTNTHVSEYCPSHNPPLKMRNDPNLELGKDLSVLAQRVRNRIKFMAQVFIFPQQQVAPSFTIYLPFILHYPFTQHNEATSSSPGELYNTTIVSQLLLFTYLLYQQLWFELCVCSTVLEVFGVIVLKCKNNKTAI